MHFWRIWSNLSNTWTFIALLLLLISFSEEEELAQFNSTSSNATSSNSTSYNFTSSNSSASVLFNITRNFTTLENVTAKAIFLDKGELSELAPENTVLTAFANKLPNPLNPPFIESRKGGGGGGGRPVTPKPSVVTTEEDKKIRKEWGGNCTMYHWEICSNLTYFGQFDRKPMIDVPKERDCLDPELFPPLCLFSGWTVTRCHLFCMTKLCNRDLKLNYEKYVSKDGFC